jgi:hypothetical protein
MRPNSVPEGHLLISLDTLQLVDAEQVLAFMHTLLYQLRQTPEIGSDAQIEIVNLSRGTIWAQIAIIVGTTIAGAGIIQVAAEAIQAELTQGNGPLAKEAAKTLEVYQGNSCTVITNHTEITVNLQSISARTAIKGEPTAPPEGFVYLTDDGKYLVNDGKFIVGKRPNSASTNAPGPRSAERMPEDRRFTNIPVGNPIQLTGRIVEDKGELEFVQSNGSIGRIDEIVGVAQPPHDVPISAMVSATRGDHGGFADRGIKLHSWKMVELPLPDQSSELGGDDSDVSVGEIEERDLDNARDVALIGQLDNSFGQYPFEFLERNGTTYFAREAADFGDMIALGQDVFIEATLAETDDGPVLDLHHLRVID